MAPRKCCIKSCENSKGTTVGIHYHGLPSCATARGKWTKWIAEVNNDDTIFQKKHAFLCSNHFNAKSRNGSRLWRGAVSSLSGNLPETTEAEINQSVVDEGAIATEPQDQQLVDVDREINETFQINNTSESQAQHTAVVYIDTDAEFLPDEAKYVDTNNNNHIDDDILCKLRQFITFAHDDSQYGTDNQLSSVIIINTTAESSTTINSTEIASCNNNIPSKAGYFTTNNQSQQPSKVEPLEDATHNMDTYEFLPIEENTYTDAEGNEEDSEENASLTVEPNDPISNNRFPPRTKVQQWILANSVKMTTEMTTSNFLHIGALVKKM